MRGVGHGAGNREGAFGGRARGSDEARPKHKSLAGKQQRKFRVDNAFWKPRRTTTRTRHFPRWIFKWMRGIFTRPRRTTAAIVCRSSTQEAIPRLPDHLVVTHILRSENFDDPADLARLPAVSCAMRAAVAATGRSPVASRIPLCCSGEERTAQEVEGVPRERVPVGREDVFACGARRAS
jgi:hypothetical protein